MFLRTGVDLLTVFVATLRTERLLFKIRILTPKFREFSYISKSFSGPSALFTPNEIPFTGPPLLSIPTLFTIVFRHYADQVSIAPNIAKGKVTAIGALAF